MQQHKLTVKLISGNIGARYAKRQGICKCDWESRVLTTVAQVAMEYVEHLETVIELMESERKDHVA